MLTPWTIALQSYDFTVENKPGKMNIISDTLLPPSSFEQDAMRVAPQLAPICRNVPDNPALNRPLQLRLYLVNFHNRDESWPVESDRELFTSGIDVFMSIDSVKLRQAQQAEFGTYFEYIIYISDPKKQPPSSGTVTSMSHYSENGALLYRSYRPGHLHKIKSVRTAINLSFTVPVYPWCSMHAMITPCQVGISLTIIRLTKRAIYFGGRHYIATANLGVMTAKHINGVNHPIGGSSTYRSPTR